MTSAKAREILGIKQRALNELVSKGQIRVMESTVGMNKGTKYTYCPASVHIYKTYKDASSDCIGLVNKCDDKWVADMIRSNPEEYHCKIYPR